MATEDRRTSYAARQKQRLRRAETEVRRTIVQNPKRRLVRKGSGPSTTPLPNTKHDGPVVRGVWYARQSRWYTKCGTPDSPGGTRNVVRPNTLWYAKCGTPEYFVVREMWYARIFCGTRNVVRPNTLWYAKCGTPEYFVVREMWYARIFCGTRNVVRPNTLWYAKCGTPEYFVVRGPWYATSSPPATG
jgi:hypothetical protein